MYIFCSTLCKHDIRMCRYILTYLCKIEFFFFFTYIPEYSEVYICFLSMCTCECVFLGNITLIVLILKTGFILLLLLYNCVNRPEGKSLEHITWFYMDHIWVGIGYFRITFLDSKLFIFFFKNLSMGWRSVT